MTTDQKTAGNSSSEIPPDDSGLEVRNVKGKLFAGHKGPEEKRLEKLPRSRCQVNPVIDYSGKRLCLKPYPGHPIGCPNYGKRDTCPPRAPFFEEVYDVTRPLWVIWNRFDIGSHVKRMREKHPQWSERQLYCCLYWQGTARKQLATHIKEFLDLFGTMIVTTCPEALGVEVTGTMRQAGHELEWPPRKWAYQVAVAGSKLNIEGPWRPSNKSEEESVEVPPR